MQKNLDIILIKNKSKVYINNSIWSSNNYGDYKIIGKTSKGHYLIEFEDETQVVTSGCAISAGQIKNPYYPYVYGKACLGRISQYHFLHKRWEGMTRRVFDINCSAYKNYGGRGILISDELCCFELYVEYISSLENYNKLLLKPELFEIDRTNNDGNYEKGNLRIITRSGNARNSRNNSIIEMSKNDEVFDLDIIVRLIEKYPQYNLTSSGISSVVHGFQKSHRDFKFNKKY